MAGGNPNDEADAKPAALTLDTLRTRHDVALILEAHSRKGEGGSSKNRPKEPFGWSGWMRWPEFGIHLADDGTITHWRGMRDERAFPHQLDRGGDWPWTPVVTLASASLEKIKDAARDAGRELSVREYERVTGVARSTVQDILSKHRLEVAQAAHGVDQDGPR